MRAFMQAIGLGGLFRRCATTPAATVASANAAKGGSFRVISLEEFENLKVQPSNTNAAFEACRKSSVAERPQFLFFCGSDKTNLPSGALPSPQSSRFGSPDESILASRLASINYPTPSQPLLSHQMPVFFAPCPVAGC